MSPCNRMWQGSTMDYEQHHRGKELDLPSRHRLQIELLTSHWKIQSMICRMQKAIWRMFPSARHHLPTKTMRHEPWSRQQPESLWASTLTKAARACRESTNANAKYHTDIRWYDICWYIIWEEMFMVYLNYIIVYYSSVYCYYKCWTPTRKRVASQNAKH